MRRELEEVRREGGEESSQHRGTKASQSSACLDSGKFIYKLMSWSIYEVLMPLVRYDICQKNCETKVLGQYLFFRKVEFCLCSSV